MEKGEVILKKGDSRGERFLEKKGSGQIKEQEELELLFKIF